MKHFLKFLLMSVVLIFPFDHIHAKEDKELRQQRQAAQKELQAKKLHGIKSSPTPPNLSGNLRETSNRNIRPYSKMWPSSSN